MNKEEYLKQLKREITSLTLDEQEQALQYYSDYFDEAQNDQQVMDELGSPEELGKMIVQKCANTLVKNNTDTQKTKSSKNTQEDTRTDKSSDKNTNDQISQALFYEYDESDVRNLAINLGASQVVVIIGKSFQIETRGMASENFKVDLSSSGTLSISNTKRLNLKFFSHDRKNRIMPRVLITVPENVNLNRLNLKIGAGSFVAKDINLTAINSEIEVGAGNLVLQNLNTGKLNIRCGMGNCDFSGTLLGRCNVDCGMGNIKMDIQENIEGYSYDAKVGLGSVSFGDLKKSGFAQVECSKMQEKHISINCGVGSVIINFKEE